MLSHWMEGNKLDIWPNKNVFMHVENKKYGPNFTIAEVEHQSWGAPLDEWKYKNVMNLYKRNYYSAILKNETLLFTAAWMELEVNRWLEQARYRTTNTICSHSFRETRTISLGQHNRTVVTKVWQGQKKTELGAPKPE